MGGFKAAGGVNLHKYNLSIYDLVSTETHCIAPQKPDSLSRNWELLSRNYKKTSRNYEIMVSQLWEKISLYNEIISRKDEIRIS